MRSVSAAPGLSAGRIGARITQGRRAGEGNGVGVRRNHGLAAVKYIRQDHGADWREQDPAGTAAWIRKAPDCLPASIQRAGGPSRRTVT